MENGKYKDGVTAKKVLDALADGANDKEAYMAGGISADTFYRWLKEHAEFSESVKKAKAFADEHRVPNLEASLYKRAMGYDIKERRRELGANPMGGAPIIVKQIVTDKQIPPDTAALIFALTNLAPDKWKNKQNTEHSGNVNTGMTFVVSSEEDKERIRALAKFNPDGSGGEDIQEEL